MFGRIRRALRWALCALVVFGLLPGAIELVENVEHLLHDGHLRHSTEHADQAVVEGCDSEVDEHGCTPLDHHCACCRSVAAVPEDPSPPSEPLLNETVPEPRHATVERLVSRAVSPPVRPPIS